MADFLRSGGSGGCWFGRGVAGRLGRARRGRRRPRRSRRFARVGPGKRDPGLRESRRGGFSGGGWESPGPPALAGEWARPYGHAPTDMPGRTCLTGRANTDTSLRTCPYGQVATGTSLRTRHYGHVTTDRSLRTCHYGHVPTDVSLRTCHYGHVTTDMSLRTCPDGHPSTDMSLRACHYGLLGQALQAPGAQGPGAGIRGKGPPFGLGRRGNLTEGPGGAWEGRSIQRGHVKCPRGAP